MNKKKKLKEKGITLVALVITIVILIILATVTINIAFGDGGLIKQAEQARNFYEQSAESEANEIEKLLEGLDGLPTLDKKRARR